MAARSTAYFNEYYLLALKDVRMAMDDHSEIMPTLAQIAWQDNAEGLMLGTDRSGVELIKLAASTLANPRRGPGGPLVPHGRESRFIVNYRARIYGNTLRMSWVDMPWAIYHFEGAGHLPRRDLRGLRAEGRLKMASTLKNWLLSKLEEGRAQRQSIARARVALMNPAWYRPPQDEIPF